jgi:ATP-binding cassette subfamily E protein 1
LRQCKKFCPVVRLGKLCVVVSKKDKTAKISEELCIGCNICTKKCPFGAIQIINLPKNLESQTTHRYGPNSFKLHRLPTPRPGQVLGLVGTNGIGKSTALKILAGKAKPNLGNFDDPPEWQHILAHFRGSELQNYFTKIIEDTIKAIIKPQYVDALPKMLKGKPGACDKLLNDKNEREKLDEILYWLDLKLVYDDKRDISVLSGGELQRFAIAVVALQDAEVYMFDEPSSYLDVKQRINAALCIRSLLTPERYVICVEHDLSVLDYLSDFICVLYGTPGVYGVVTLPFSVRDGINIFLAGFIPTENLRFRPYGLSFKMVTQAEETGPTAVGGGGGEIQGSGNSKKKHATHYPSMTKTQGGFKLHIEEGSFTHSEIVVLLGQNGTGKTTFIRLFAAVKDFAPDEAAVKLPELNISYKPQKIAPTFEGSVRDLLHKKIKEAYLHSQFQTDVFKPLMIEELLDQEVKNLSGGELQRLAIVLCLGKAADVYLIDEPSAYLDSEQRVSAAKVIKRYIMHSRKTAFIVEHDFIMATYLADKVIYYDGVPSVECTAHAPESLLSGMNKFLAQLNITFRRDPSNWRPRINKHDSVKDAEQKLSGNYFFM